MTQHSDLTADRWARFTLEQQVLMIGNEMQRGAHWLVPDDAPSLRRCYERVLRLVDLTIETAARPTLRRELLRWRDLVAAMYVAPAPDPAGHAAAFRCLLLLTPGSARQIPFMATPGTQGDPR